MEAKNMSTQSNLITEIRNGSKFRGSVAALVVAAVFWLSVYPTLLVAQEYLSDTGVTDRSPTTDESKFNSTLVQLEQLLLTLSEYAQDRKNTDDIWKSIDSEQSQMREIDAKIMSRFVEVGIQIARYDIPDSILARHENTVDKYRGSLDSLLEGIDRLRDESNRKRLIETSARLASNIGSIKKKRSDQIFDPNQLPARQLRPESVKSPKASIMEFHVDEPLGDFRHVHASIEPPLPTDDDAFSNPDWLSESDEVRLSQVILDKADELSNDTVQIYHWVRNNIAWNPNWGAKQTAQLTLELKSGNAFDIASLTVALMRAANTPARYVHGTIDVPADEVRNWAGGFEDLQSAMDFASSGAMPLGAVISGGVVTAVRMEHVWVEVAIDFVPAKGATDGPPDSWISIDPSFKQYEFLDGLDVAAIAGLDIEQLGQDFVNTGVVDNAEGWVSGFDGATFDIAQDDVKVAIDDYVAANLPNPTVGEVLGGRRTIVQESPTLSASLPNTVVVAGTRYASIPASLQQTMTFVFDPSSIGGPANAVTFSWAELNNERITLTFPSDSADNAVLLEALLPSEPITDLSQLPSSVPAYLLGVIPELRLGGAVVLTGEAMTLGEELNFRFNVGVPGIGIIPNEYNVVAGSYLNVSAVSNNASPTRMASLQADIDEMEAVTAGSDPNQLVALGDERILGDLYYATGLTYYAQVATMSRVSAQQQNKRYELLAGVGTFGYIPEPVFVLGIPVELRNGGLVSDRPIVAAIGADTPGATIEEAASEKQSMAFTAGLLSSALEHLVPEELFPVEQGTTADGISTVKAFQKALDAGQRLYEITPQNFSMTIGALNLDQSTVDNITLAINSGKHVITHTDPVSVPGWSGAGYVVVDPVTGEGAYLISGGANGGFLLYLVAAIVLYIVMALLIYALLMSPGLFILGLFSVAEGVQIGNTLLDIFDSCNGLILALTLFIVIIATLLILFAPGPGTVAGALGFAIAANLLTALVPKPNSTC